MAVDELPRLVISDLIFDKMVAAGIFTADERVRRVVIDLPAGEVPVIYVERFGDDRLLNVATTLDGVQVRCGEDIIRAKE